MASRVRIAAAACVVASGLFVGSASAATAFADTPSGQGVGDGPAQANAAPTGETAGSPSAAPPAAAAELAAGGVLTAKAPDPGAATAGLPKPKSYVGDGRHGMESERSGDGTGRPAPSKQSETYRRTPPQTPPKQAGEPEGPDGPAADDPTKPDDPKDHQPGFGWPWWGPCPNPHDPHGPDDPDDPGPGLPPGNGSGGGGGSQPKPPSGRPELPPAMQLPPPREVPPELPNISADPAIEAATGLAAAAAELPFGPITLPTVVAPLGVGGVGPSGGAGGSVAGPRAGNPSAPRGPGAPQNNQPEPKSGQQSPPAFSAGSGVPPASFRVGYGNYLRSANVGQIMAVALPGVAGILVLTGAGGLLGFRQARAGRAVRASGTARFIG